MLKLVHLLIYKIKTLEIFKTPNSVAKTDVSKKQN